MARSNMWSRVARPPIPAPTCPDDGALMAQAPGFFAVTAVEADASRLQFKPDVGVPLRLYVCPRCGTLTLRLASMDPEWPGPESAEDV